MSLRTHFLEYDRHVARLHRRAYAPTSNTASHDSHKENPSWVSFFSRDACGAPLGGPSGRRGSAITSTSILQTAVDQTQLIRIMISSMDDTTKSKLFKDKQKAQQPITINNLRVVQSDMVFMHQNSIVRDVSTMAIHLNMYHQQHHPLHL